MKRTLKKIPVIGVILQWLYAKVLSIKRPFRGSQDYWDSRYEGGGSSGDGSRGILAQFKAEFLNRFVSENGIEEVIEWGCGDGGQLQLANYESYLGLDISPRVIEKCRALFRDDPAKSFGLVKEYDGEKRELAISLDVIYHLVESEVFRNYMEALFASSMKFVVIYSSNTNTQSVGQGGHVRHRKFSDWIQENRPEWEQVDFVGNEHPYSGDSQTGSFADFYVYQKR